MHTTKVTDDEGNEWYCHYNGDFSGSVQFVLPGPDFVLERPMSDRLGPRIEIPFEVLKEIVAKWKRDEAISKLEDASPDDILKRF